MSTLQFLFVCLNSFLTFRCFSSGNFWRLWRKISDIASSNWRTNSIFSYYWCRKKICCTWHFIAIPTWIRICFHLLLSIRKSVFFFFFFLVIPSQSIFAWITPSCTTLEETVVAALWSFSVKHAVKGEIQLVWFNPWLCCLISQSAVCRKKNDQIWYNLDHVNWQLLFTEWGTGKWNCKFHSLIVSCQFTIWSLLLWWKHWWINARILL